MLLANDLKGRVISGDIFQGRLLCRRRRRRMEKIRQAWVRNKRGQMFAISMGSFTLGIITFYFISAHTYSGCGMPVQPLYSNHDVGDTLSKDQLLRKYGNTSIENYVNIPVPADSADKSFECLQGKLDTMTFPICIFNPYFDIHVSAWIKKNDGAMWEGKNILKLLTELGPPHDDAGFIDVGANIGVFSLSAAHAGHKVVSVEPMPAALRRFKQSIKLGGIGELVQVVQAALSNDTKPLYLLRGRLNKGGSHLVPESECSSGIFSSCDTNHPIPLFHIDDLTKVITFKTAVMKVDCEGFEYRVFKKAAKLFDTVNITYIEMEWMHIKKFIKYDLLRPEAEELTQFFKTRGYGVFSLKGDSLADVHWKDWPDDVAWKK